MNTGGPAFPQITPKLGPPINDHLIAQGMTLRDYFAAKAMQAIINRSDGRFATDLDFVSGKSYQYADAMLKAREQ
jgi:hypothetical protein